MPDGRTSVQHANCLRRFTQRTEYVNVAVVEADIAKNYEDDSLLLFDWDIQSGCLTEKFRVGNHLSVEQQRQMHEVWN
jgi:frataxin-like iron-binding protein CyaY